MTKNNSLQARSKTIWLAVALFLSLFLVGNVSAVLQTISYSTDKTQVEVKDFLGLGTTIATVKLNNPLVNNFIEVGKDKIVFSFEVDTKWDNFKDAISNSVKILDMNKGGKEVNYKTYKWVYAVYENVSVNDYKYSCENIESPKGNATQICSDKVVGSHLESQIAEWKELTSFDFAKGKVTIGLMTDVNEGDYYDGIPTLFDKEFGEWVTWEAIVRDWSGYTYNNCGPGYGASSMLGMYVQSNLSNWRLLAFNTTATVTCDTCGAYDTASNTYYTGVMSNYNCSFSPYPEIANGSMVILYFNITSGSCVQCQRDVGVYPSTGQTNVVFIKGIQGSNVSQTVNIVDVWTQREAPVPPDAPPAVTIISPANNTIYNSGTGINISCNSTDDIGVTDLAIMETGELSDLDFTTLNYTDFIVNSTSYENLSLSRLINRGEGWYSWTCQANDSINHIVRGENRTFLIDYTTPTITITNPLNLTTILTTTVPLNLTLNSTVNDSYGGYTTIPTLSVCWIANTTTNATYSCNQNASGMFGSGWNTIDFYANDSAGNEGKESTTFYINLYSYTKSAVDTIIEKGNTTVYFNLTAGSITTATTNLTYNNTLYVMSAGTNNGTFVRFSANITAPEVTADTNMTYNFTYVLDGTSGVTADYGMVVYDFVGLNATGFYCDNASYNFTLVDEANFSQLYGEFEYNFLYDVGGSEYRNYGKSNSTNLYVCVNKTISPTWIIKEGEIHYRADNYVDRRYYIFDNTVVANKITNITLYDLFSADQTSFKLTVTDNSLNPYSDKFTTLVRWYPDLNQYNIVDMGNTDEKGETIIHVRTEDVDYRIGLYDRDGTLIKLANPVRMVCITTPCEYTLRVSPAGIDYFNFLNIQYTFDYDSTSHLWSFVWSDSSGTTDEMNMTIYKMTGTEVYPVCENTLTAVSGALSCNTTLFTGTLKGVVTRTASPPVTIASKIITTTVTAFKSKFGLFLTFIIAVPIIFIFALVSPIGAVIGGIVALIPALYFGAISWVVLAGLTVLGGIVIHFLKRIG